MKQSRTTAVALKTPLNIETRYRDLLEHMPVGVYRTAADGTILECNPMLASILGYTNASEVRQINAALLYVNPRERKQHLDRFESESSQCEEFRLKKKDGSILHVKDYTYVVRDENGKIQYYDGIIVDITDQKCSEQALKDSERDYRELFEHAHDAILIITVDKEIILDVNKRACALYGFTREEFIGISLESLSKNVSLGKERIKKTLEETSIENFETVHFNKKGEEMILEVNAAVISFRSQLAILSINRDITERKKMEETIHRLAYFDTLSGLPNRKLFMDRFAQALAQAERNNLTLAVLFLDLDGFKSINDNFGHAKGDDVIAKVGARLAKIIRKGDTVARLGGDEFVILVPEAKTEEGIIRIASKSVKEIKKAFSIGNQQALLSVSVGIAVFPRDGVTVEDLLKRADAALYKVKTKGKDSYQFFSRY